MFLRKLFEEYLESTTVHGFAYIHGRQHWIIRILWCVIIITGFVWGGSMINEGFKDWLEEPVITTLDTISAPISDIQFPTITVCQETPPDNWALPEKILNLLAFECTNDPESLKCLDLSKQIKNDFKFLIKSFITKLKLLLKDIDATILTKTWHGSIEKYNQSGILNRVAEIISQGELEKLEDAAIQYFSSKVEMRKIVGELGNDYPIVPCTSETCKKNQDEAMRTLLILRDFENGMSFGSFITQFIHLNELKSFGSCRNDDNNNMACNSMMVSCGWDPFTNGELKLQKYLTHLSIFFGFNDTELVSLYDIPGILANHLDFERKVLMDNLLGDWPQAYLYTCCQEGLQNPDFVKCLWKGETLNKTMPEDSFDEVPCKTHRWTDKMGHNLQAIMKVMRFATRRGTTDQNLEFVNATTDQSKYPLGNFDSRKQLLTTYDMNAMILMCALNTGGPPSLVQSWQTDYLVPPTCRGLFQPVITDNGICQSFNAEPVLNLLTSPSYFTDSFRNAFADDIFDDKSGDTLAKGTGSGSKHGLNLILAGNSLTRKNINGPSEFMVGLSAKNDYFEMDAQRHIVRAGYHTIFKFQAMKIEPSSDLADISPDKRGCRIGNEVGDLKMFKVYSQSACQLEMKIKFAEQYCQCVPWYYPSFWNKNGDRHIICDKLGNHCFKTKMDEKQISSEICPSQCEQLRFITSREIEKLDPEKECLGKQEELTGIEINIARQQFMHWTGKHVDNPDVSLPIFLTYEKMMDYTSGRLNTSGLWTGDDYENNYHILSRETCKALIKQDLARVSFQFESKQYVLTKTNIRVSFNDKLSSFGGTLGLFTGMSILSMCEIAFWIFKGLLGLKDRFPLKSTKI